MQKIEAIIKEQFSVEMKNKEHEIEVIDQVCIFSMYYYYWGRRLSLDHITNVSLSLFLAPD